MSEHNVHENDNVTVGFDKELERDRRTVRECLEQHAASFNQWAAEEAVKTLQSLDSTTTSRVFENLHLVEIPNGARPEDHAVYVCETVEACPEYEDWTPVTANTYHPNQLDVLEFVPYANDPKFPAAEYIEHFHNNPRLRDPDLDAIEIQTAWHLHNAQNFTFEQIDRTKLLSRPVQSRDGEADLMTLLTERDFPKIWRWSKTRRHPLRDLLDEPSHTLHDRLQNLVGTYCPVLGCSDILCIHEPSQLSVIRALAQSRITPPPLSNTPICGPSCCKIGNTSHSLMFAKDKPKWTLQETENFKLILDVVGDISACDLAVICNAPCNEVRIMQVWCILERKPVVSKDQHKSNNGDTDRTYADFGTPESFAYFDPCSHSGFCTSADKCECRKHSTHCTRGCGCAEDCPRRFRGCRCTINPLKATQTCRTDKCPCFRMNRECMPELCTTCRAGGEDCKDCQNCPMQLRIKKHLVVRPSKYGWGTFIMEYVTEGSFIAQYLGEILGPDEADARSYQSSYLGRNYRFELNRYWLCDASLHGNETRFINHSRDGANVRARVRIMDFEHSVEIYALRDLRPGEEIFLDYGEHYFSEHEQESTSSPTKPGVMTAAPSRIASVSA